MTTNTGERGMFDWPRMEACALHLSPAVTIHPKARRFSRALWYSQWPEVISRVEQMHRDLGGGCHQHVVWRMRQADAVFLEYAERGRFPEYRTSDCLFWIVIYRERAVRMKGRVEEARRLAEVAYSLARAELFATASERADALSLSAATLGNAERLLGNLDRALELTAEARKSLQTMNPRVLFRVYTMSGIACLERQGESGAATTLLERAHRIASSKDLGFSSRSCSTPMAREVTWQTAKPLVYSGLQVAGTRGWRRLRSERVGRALIWPQI
ncbi:MAG: hypothetical protein GY769_07630 [bacterium]|nr:hypothetical protein [bacterium]